MVSQGDAIDKLGRDEDHLVRAADLINGENVWMVE